MSGNFVKAAIILSAVALMGVSCQKESAREEAAPAKVNLVPITFSAELAQDEVSKAYLAENGLSSLWKAGDKIAIYDDVTSVAHEFTAVSTGETTSFTGEVSEGATQFYAIYPYSAAVSYDMTSGKAVVNLPESQKPVVGGYDPEANIFTGSTTASDLNIRFLIAGSLLKFTLAQSDIISVSITGTRDMAGGITFTQAIGDTGFSGMTASGTTYKMITLANADGSPLEAGTYYIPTRHTGSNSHTSLSITLVNQSLKMASKTGESALQVVRQNIHNLGSSADWEFVTSRYAAYQAGYDIQIYGRTYNKATYGDAILVEIGETNTDVRSQLNNKTGVIFLRGDGRTMTSSGTISVNGNFICIGDNDEAIINSSGAFNIVSGAVAFKYVTLDGTGRGNNSLFGNQNSTANPAYLVFEDCKFVNIARYIYGSNSTSGLDYIPTEVVFNRCDIGLAATMGSSPVLVNPNSAHKAVQNLKKFVFTNNIFHKSGSNVAIQLFNYNTTPEDAAARTWGTEVTVDNNIFYNTNTNSGSYRNYRVKSFSYKGNLQFADAAYAPSSNQKVFDSVYHPDTSLNIKASGNAAYAPASEAGKWVICNSDLRTEDMEAISFLTENPFSNETTFTLKDAYKQYGPQE